MTALCPAMAQEATLQSDRTGFVLPPSDRNGLERIIPQSPEEVRFNRLTQNFKQFH